MLYIVWQPLILSAATTWTGYPWCWWWALQHQSPPFTTCCPLQCPPCCAWRSSRLRLPRNIWHCWLTRWALPFEKIGKVSSAFRCVSWLRCTKDWQGNLHLPYCWLRSATHTKDWQGNLHLPYCWLRSAPHTKDWQGNLCLLYCWLRSAPHTKDWQGNLCLLYCWLSSAPHTKDWQGNLCLLYCWLSSAPHTKDWQGNLCLLYCWGQFHTPRIDKVISTFHRLPPLLIEVISTHQGLTR